MAQVSDGTGGVMRANRASTSSLIKARESWPRASSRVSRGGASFMSSSCALRRNREN